jgi:hypothetical protein
MLASTLVALLQGSVLIEPAGFSVVREGVDVKVDWVAENGPASKCRLEVGSLILRVQGPEPRKGKELAKLDDEQLRELLTPPFFEPLHLWIKPATGYTPRVMLSRADAPPPDYYANIPWPAERLAKLTATERSQYDGEVRLRELQESSNPPTVSLRPSDTILVTVRKGPSPAINTMSRGTFNATQVTWAGTLEARCGLRAVERLKVLEPTLPELPPASGPKVQHEVKWPLFPAAKVVESCSTGEATVGLQREVKLELTCAGKPPKPFTVTTTLMVDCLPP